MDLFTIRMAQQCITYYEKNSLYNDRIYLQSSECILRNEYNITVLTPSHHPPVMYFSDFTNHDTTHQSQC